MMLVEKYKLFSLILISFFYSYSQKLKAQNQVELSPVEMVYPLLDAANSRWFFFNSATLPFGMVNLSPDMGVEGDWDSGYLYEKNRILFFSHIHAWQLSGIPVMPVTGEFKGHLGSRMYSSAYSHHNETVEVGYHSVRRLLGYLAYLLY